MTTGDDAERDAFVRTLVEVATETGWNVESMRQHPLFEAMLAIHGEDQVRHWLLLDALRTLRCGELLRRRVALYAELQQLRALVPDSGLSLAVQEWRVLHQRHGLALDAEGLDAGLAVDAGLAGDDWLAPGVLPHLQQYFAQVRLR